MANRCLCCHKPVETNERHHPRCLNRLFGTARRPEIPFGVADLPGIVTKAEGRMSISGVQAKVSIRLDKASGNIEPVVAGGTHILKPESDRFPEIPMNENLCMNMAEELGMRVPPHGLFAMSDGKLCYIIKRFDRADDGRKIPNETMFQIAGSTDKYIGSLEQVGKTIRAHATNVGLDMIDFFERALLCFLTGNGDMHLKNWALLGQGKDIALAPCYDLVSSRLYIEKEGDSALTINAKKNKLRRSDFEALAKNLRIDAKAAANIFDRLERAQDTLRGLIAQSELRADLRQELMSILGARYNRLYGKVER
ncbi:MAG: HipA domain-containing protein [Elusimicrobia bacterium]|nr:HipA domain-containing protein [Elusimicrobiota bacterium]